MSNYPGQAPSSEVIGGHNLAGSWVTSPRVESWPIMTGIAALASELPTRECTGQGSVPYQPALDLTPYGALYQKFRSEGRGEWRETEVKSRWN